MMGDCRGEHRTGDAARQRTARSDAFEAGLCRLSGVAAVLAAIIFRRNWSAELFLLNATGIIARGPAEAPTSAAGWFSMLQEDVLIGLILFNVVDLINYALVGIVLLGLYAALRRGQRVAAALAVVSGWIGVVIAFASNRGLAMLSLSRDYAASAAADERALLLAAGEALLAVDNPATLKLGSGETSALLLVTLSSMAMGILMLRHPAFDRRTAWLGIAAEGIQMGTFAALVLAPSPALLALPPSLAAPLRLAWYVLVGRRLIRMAGGRGSPPASPAEGPTAARSAGA
jgi:hypothetical protein